MASKPNMLDYYSGKSNVSSFTKKHVACAEFVTFD